MATNDETEDFASMLAEFEQGEKKKKKDPQPGEEVRGRVVSIGRDAVFLDLGTKSDGMIELAELRDGDGKLTVQVGDEVTARVAEGSDRAGVIVLRRLLGRGAEGRSDLEQAYAHQIPVEGVVSAVNKGGVEVTVAGVRAFCPISQLDARHVEDATPYIGQKLTFRITRYEATGRNLNLVVSRRVILEEEAQEKAKATRGRLEPGAVLRGRVSAIKDFGAFVDLGGIEGMLHVSELGFQRVKHPSEVLAVGQEIEVQVLRVEKTDDPKRPERVALSLKSLERDPWSDAKERFPEGARRPGTVTRVETYGAFVELAPGIEGLVHVSELGQGKHLRHAKDAVKPGQPLEVIVLEVDAERRRVSLGLPGGGGRDDEEAPRSTGPSPGLGTFADLLKKKP
jgi:small subunit ribosomal protein S1